MPAAQPPRPSPGFLAECRHHAHELRRRLRSPDLAVVRAAVQRVLGSPAFAGCSEGELVLRPEQVQLQQALAVVAHEVGFPSWQALRTACEATWLSPNAMYAPAMAQFLNRWFADYDEARAAQLSEGGYLLPYRNYFFLTTGEAIRELGLDPDDPDWAAIGHDWVRPRDERAHRRLVVQRKRALGA